MQPSPEGNEDGTLITKSSASSAQDHPQYLSGYGARRGSEQFVYGLVAPVLLADQTRSQQGSQASSFDN